MERSSSPVQCFQQPENDPRFWTHLFPGATTGTPRIRSRSADLPARPTISQNSSPTTPTGSGKFQHISLPSSETQYGPFYTGDYASDDEYNSPQDSPEEMDFELDAESARRPVPPVDYVSQPHEHLGDPQSGQHLQVSHQTPANRRLRGEAKPFNRVSKTGKSHFVTPASACVGFRCTFTDNGQPCSDTDTFKLPSAMREHLIAKHMLFSPFQCANCKRVFTRLALETRHLQKQDTGQRICPNEKQMGDENYQARCRVRTALWDIRTKQEEVDKAVLLIKSCNGQLEGRKRRGAQRDPTPFHHQSPTPSSGSGAFLPTCQPSHSHTLIRHHSHSPSRNALRDSTSTEFQYANQLPQFGHTLQHQHQAANYHTTQHAHQPTNDWSQLQQPRHPAPSSQFVSGYPSQFTPPSSGADPNSLYRTDYH